ncbi:hypothetical protein [Burkholderia ubonensis]|nr:hypothetical protein [Burkholderia ubonensis]
MNTNETVLMPSLTVLMDLATKLDITPTEAGHLYRLADRMLKSWYPSDAAGDRVELSPKTLILASRINDQVKKCHPSLGLVGRQLFEVVGIFQERMTHQYDTDSEDGFAAAVDDSLEIAGLLDTAGDCPICHKSGHISASRHHVCARLILARANCQCAHCGKPASNTYGWKPVCEPCDEHQNHLDALCD